MRHAPRPAAKKKREDEEDDDEDEFEGEDGLSPQQARRGAGLEQGVGVAGVRGECPLVWSIPDGHTTGRATNALWSADRKQLQSRRCSQWRLLGCPRQTSPTGAPGGGSNSGCCRGSASLEGSQERAFCQSSAWRADFLCRRGAGGVAADHSVRGD